MLYCFLTVVKIFSCSTIFIICLFPTTMFGNFPVFLPPKAANAIHWKSNLSELLVPYYCQYQHVDIISIGWCFLTYVIEVLDIFSAVCKLQKLMFCMIMTLPNILIFFGVNLLTYFFWLNLLTYWFRSCDHTDHWWQLQHESKQEPRWCFTSTSSYQAA